jgi:hypothetical protein
MKEKRMTELVKTKQALTPQKGGFLDAFTRLRSWRRPLPSGAVRRQSTSRQKVE